MMRSLSTTRVAGHLVDTLVSLELPAELNDEAAAVVIPLRGAFEQGADKFGGKDE
jgi:hypothetical protein